MGSFVLKRADNVPSLSREKLSRALHYSVVYSYVLQVATTTWRGRCSTRPPGPLVGNERSAGGTSRRRGQRVAADVDLSTYRDAAESFGSFRLSSGRTRAYSHSQSSCLPGTSSVLVTVGFSPAGFYISCCRREKKCCTRDATRQCAAACVRGSEDQTVGGAVVGCQSQS